MVGYDIWGRPKSPASKRAYPAGQHGPNQKDNNRRSEYGEQLLAKQVIRRYYNMLEKQFSNTFKKAQRMNGNTSLNFLRLLEMRLGTAVWRLGYAKTIFQARQMVSHCHITVNGKKCNIPSYQCKPGEVIGVRANPKSQQLVGRFLEMTQGNPVPGWMTQDRDSQKGTVNRVPVREEINPIANEQLVVELYSR